MCTLSVQMCICANSSHSVQNIFLDLSWEIFVLLSQCHQIIIWCLENAAFGDEVKITVALQETSMSYCLLRNWEKLVSNVPCRQIKINLSQPAETTDKAK